MTATCQPLPRSVAEEMLQVVARAICDRPGDSPVQRESRTRQMVHTTLGSEPRDGLEYMLSTLVFAHFNLILDSMHDVFQGQLDLVKARTKTTIVALDRSMLALVRELREARKRPLEQAAEAVTREEAQTAEAASRPGAAGVSNEPLPEPQAISPEMRHQAEARQASGPAKPPGSEAPRVVPLQTPHRPKAMPLRQTTSASRQPPCDPDEGTFEGHIAAFEQALAAATETLTEARALDGARMAAAGD
jgi:hypothetical protein